MFFTWNGSIKDLIKFLNERKTKHESNKFEFQISKTIITVLDINVSINNNNLYRKVYKNKKQIVKHSLA